MKSSQITLMALLTFLSQEIKQTLDALAVSQTPVEEFYRTHSPDTL